MTVLRCQVIDLDQWAGADAGPVADMGANASDHRPSSADTSSGQLDRRSRAVPGFDGGLRGVAHDFQDNQVKLGPPPRRPFPFQDRRCGAAFEYVSPIKS